MISSHTSTEGLLRQPFFVSTRSIHRLSAALTIAVIAFCLLGGTIPESVQWTMLLVFGGILGLGHGAVDHMLASDVLRWVAPRRRGLFIAGYVALVGLFIGLWLLEPALAFGLFLLASAWHFGQADVQQIDAPLTHGKRQVLSLVWGLSLVAAFSALARHTGTLSEPGPDVARALGPLLDLSTLCGIGTGALFGSILWFAIESPASRRALFGFAGRSALILLVIAVAPPIVSFALYFGLWHAIPSLAVEYDALRGAGTVRSVADFVKRLVPFTVVSLVGVVVIAWIAGRSDVYIGLILLSSLAIPHIVLMHRLLESQAKRAA